MATAEQLQAWDQPFEYDGTTYVIEPPLDENYVDALAAPGIDIHPDTELTHDQYGTIIARGVLAICGDMIRIAGPEVMARQLVKYKQ